MQRTTLDCPIIGGYFAVSFGSGRLFGTVAVRETLFGGWAMGGMLGAVALAAAALVTRRPEKRLIQAIQKPSGQRGWAVLWQ